MTDTEGGITAAGENAASDEKDGVAAVMAEINQEKSMEMQLFGSDEENTVGANKDESVLSNLKDKIFGDGSKSKGLGE